MATALMVVGGLVSAVSSYRQGQYMEAVGDANAQQQRYEAQAARDKADFDIAQHRRDVSKLKSSQRMSLLKSGVSLEGSALELLADTELQSKIDEDIIRYNAETQAQGLEYEAQMSQAEGAQGKSAGETGAVSSLLSTTGKFAKTKTGKAFFKI